MITERDVDLFVDGYSRLFRIPMQPWHKAAMRRVLEGFERSVSEPKADKPPIKHKIIGNAATLVIQDEFSDGT